MEADANFASVKDLKKRFEIQKSNNVPEHSGNFKSPQQSVTKCPTETEDKSNESKEKMNEAEDFDSMDAGILALNKELDLAFVKMTAISRKLKRLSINNVDDAVQYADQLTAKLETTVKKCHRFKKKFLLKRFVEELEKAKQAGNCEEKRLSSDSGSEGRDDGTVKCRQDKEVGGDKGEEINDKIDVVDDVKVVEPVEDCEDDKVINVEQQVDAVASQNDDVAIELNNERADGSDDNAETKQDPDVAVANTETKDVAVEPKSKRGDHDDPIEVNDGNPAQVKKARFKSQTVSSYDTVSIGSASSGSCSDAVEKEKKLSRFQLKKIFKFKLYKYFHRLRLIGDQTIIECTPCQEIIESTVVDDILSSDHLLSLKHVENVLKFNAEVNRLSLVQRPDFLVKLNIPEEFLWNERLFINANPKLIFCGVCRMELSFHAKGIRRHVRETSHIEAKRTPAIERKYNLLEPRMLDFLKINRVLNLPHRKDKLNCIACDLEMKCTHSAVVGHCQSSEHQSKLNEYNNVVLADILKSNPDLFGIGRKYPITPQQLKENNIFINPVSEFAYCGICKTEINLMSIQFDVMKHVESQKHGNKVQVLREMGTNWRDRKGDVSKLRNEAKQDKCEDLQRSEENKENEDLNGDNVALVEDESDEALELVAVAENDNVNVGESDVIVKKEIIERLPLSETSSAAIDFGSTATPGPPPPTPSSQSWHLPDVDWIRFESEIKQLSKKNLSDFENLVREKMNLPTTIESLVPPKQEVVVPRIVSLSLEGIYDKESQNPSLESTNLFYVTSGKFFCPVCNIRAIPSKTAVFEHFKLPQHYKNAKSLSDPTTPYAQDWKFLMEHTISHDYQSKAYKCFICSKKLYRDLLSANQHANSATHLHKLMLSKLDGVAKKNLVVGDTQTKNTSNSNPYMPDNRMRKEVVGLSPTSESVIKKVGDYYMCVQCEVDIISIPMAYAHLRSVGHAPVIVNCVQYLREANYHCLACDVKVYGIKDVVYHIGTTGHKTKVNC